MAEEYIKEYGKLPAPNNENKRIASLSNWIYTQIHKYKNNKGIMKNKNIKVLWKDFIERYKTIFIKGEELWYYKKDILEVFIQRYNKLPSKADKNDDNRSLGNWISIQRQNYKKNKEIMTNKKIKRDWKNFIDKYQELFMTDEKKWFYQLRKIEEYIKDYGKIPERTDKDIKIKSLATWIFTQNSKFEKKEHIMINNDINVKIKREWIDFREKYKEFLMTRDELWI